MAEKRNIAEIYDKAHAGASAVEIREDEATPGLKGVSLGVAKGELKTLQGISRLGATMLEKFNLVGQVTEFVTGGRTKAPEAKPLFTPEFEQKLEPVGSAEKTGFFAEKVAEFVAPATRVAKLAEGANFLTRLGSRAFTSGTVATGQAGEVGKETAIAAGIETLFPVAAAVAKPIFNIIRRLTRGLGSALSGVSTDAIDLIVENPQKAIEISKQLEKSGNFAVLEENARVIVEGVSKIRQEARKAFGEGLAKLKAVDINPQKFRQAVQSFLDSVGSSVKGNIRTLKNVEFSEQKNLQKASNLIEEFATTKLDGLSLRRLLKKISNSRFKTTGSDTERLSFNAFITDMEKAIKTAIAGSTNKLDEINKAFSKDLQLTEGIEKILGKIKFKSLKELDTVAKKLEQLFSQKGLDPREIDVFLERLGISPAEFRTSEAVRQITGKITGANTKGLSFAEITQQLTSAVLTPEAVRNAAILTGLTEQVLKPVLEATAPAVRATLIQLIIDSQR